LDNTNKTIRPEKVDELTNDQLMKRNFIVNVCLSNMDKIDRSKPTPTFHQLLHLLKIQFHLWFKNKEKSRTPYHKQSTMEKN